MQNKEERITTVLNRLTFWRPDDGERRHLEEN